MKAELKKKSLLYIPVFKVLQLSEDSWIHCKLLLSLFEKWDAAN